MKKMLGVLGMVILVMPLFASPISISLSPGARINMQKDYVKPDMTFADEATSVYADATLSLDVDIVAGLGLSFRLGVPYPVSIVADDAKLNAKFNGISFGTEVSYQYKLSDKWAIGALAGIFQYTIPISKTTPVVDGSKTITTTYDSHLFMFAYYGGLTGRYTFNNHFSAGIAVRAGGLMASTSSIGKTIVTEVSEKKTTTYGEDTIKQSGFMIYPTLSVSYRF